MADTKTYNLAIELIMKAQNFVQGQQQVQKASDSTRKNLQETERSTLSMGKAFQSVGGYVAGFLAVGKAVQFVNQGLQTFAQRDRELRRFEAQIRATGGAAGLTAKQLQDLSRQQALDTLGDTKGVADAISTLATFRTVFGDTFKRAISLSSDLGEVLNQGVASSAGLLGQALEDPIQGISRLTRAKVSFTEEEEKQIKRLQESGRLYEAQSIILDVIEKQVGGVAKAAAVGYAGALDTATHMTDELAEAIGSKLAPAAQSILAVYSNVTQGITALIRSNPITSVAGQLEFVTERIEQEFAPRIAQVQQLIAQENERLGKLRANQEKQTQSEIKTYLDDVANYRVTLDREYLASANLSAEQWIQIEADAVQQIKNLNQDLAGTILSIDDEIRARRRETLTEAGQQADIQDEIAEKFAKISELMASGDSEGARALADNVRQLTGQVKDVDQAEAALESLKQKYAEITAIQVTTQQGVADVASEQSGTVTVDADISEAESNIATLQEELADLERERRTIVIKTRIEPLKDELKKQEGEFSAYFKAFLGGLPAGALLRLGGELPGFAKGGSIPGYGGGDRIPALLEAGEYVINKRTAAQFRPLLDRLNFGGPIARFADGGSVGGRAAAQNLGEFTWNINNNGTARRGTLIGERNSVNQLLATLSELSR